MTARPRRGETGRHDFTQGPAPRRSLILAIVVDVGVACSSSTETTLPPPPGSSSSSTSSSSSGSPDAGISLCSIAVSLNLPLCTPCNEMVINQGGACGALSMTCLDDAPCLAAAQCVGRCDAEGGADKLPCVEGCLAGAPADYADYITCIGDHCADCNTAGLDCMIGDGGAEDGDAAKEGGMCAAETDVGCGGANCPQCGIGQKCKANSDCFGNTCTGDFCSCPTGMVSVPITGGGGHFCVDAVEVTYTQYQSFYSANPALTQPQACSATTSYTPSSNWPAAPAQAAQPVRYVSWCQAVDYCLWAGKRLCGMIGGGSVSIASGLTTADQPVQRPVVQRVLRAGRQSLPLRQQLQPDPVQRPGRVRRRQHGPLVAEPEHDLHRRRAGRLRHERQRRRVGGPRATPTVGPNDNCLVRGGSYLSTETQLGCLSTPTQMRSYQGPDVGFRCCL